MSNLITYQCACIAHWPAIPSVFMQPPRPAATCSSTSLGGIVAEAHFYAGTPRDPIANLTAKLRAAVLLQPSAEGVFRAWARHDGCLSRVDFHGFVQALGLAHPIQTVDAIFVVADKQASRAILFPHHCRTPLFAPHCFPPNLIVAAPHCSHPIVFPQT